MLLYFVDVREIGVGMMEPAKLDDERYVEEQKQEEKLPNEQYQPKVGRPRPRPPIQRRNGFRRSRRSASLHDDDGQWAIQMHEFGSRPTSEIVSGAEGK